jgi:hypothetical protein
MDTVAMPSRAGLIRSRLVRLGGYVVGVAISERIFRPRDTHPSALGSVLNVGREEFVAVRWEVGRMNEDRLTGVAKRLIAGDRMPHRFGPLIRLRRRRSDPGSSRS